MALNRKSPPNELRKRPMAVVRQIGLFSREVVEHLSVSGVEMLLSQLSRLSEGQVVDGRYYGSTMLTLDLRTLEGKIRDACDVTTAMRLARLWSDNQAVIAQVRSLAHAEAIRIAARPLAPGGIDVKIRAEGGWLFVDVDVEAAVESAPLTRHG
jgi:hypothetical protein